MSHKKGSKHTTNKPEPRKGPSLVTSDNGSSDDSSISGHELGDRENRHGEFSEKEKRSSNDFIYISSHKRRLRQRTSSDTPPGPLETIITVHVPYQRPLTSEESNIRREITDLIYRFTSRLGSRPRKARRPDLYLDSDINASRPATPQSTRQVRTKTCRSKRKAYLE